MQSDSNPETTKSQRNAIEEVAAAHTDINIFEAALRLMEGSMVSPASHVGAARIIAICKAEQQKCLRRYDAAMHKAEGSR